MLHEIRFELPSERGMYGPFAIHTDGFADDERRHGADNRDRLSHTVDDADGIPGFAVGIDDFFNCPFQTAGVFLVQLHDSFTII